MKKNSFSQLLTCTLLALLLLFSTGCSIFTSEEVTPETKMAVLRICDEYLRNLANGMSSQAEAMIAWSDYKPAIKGGLTRSGVGDIIKSKKGIWSKEENPLLGLDVIDTDIGGDKASVELVKKSTGGKIELELSWIGRGWVIIGDNILSKDGAFRR